MSTLRRPLMPTSLSALMVPSTSCLALVQWLALGSMLIDHLGAVLILGEWSRLVGRIALPSFILMIGCNAMVTPRPGRMAARCLLLLLLSQPLWWLTFGHWHLLNIMVTLLTVVLLVWSWRDASPLGYLGFLLTLLGFFVLSPLVEAGVWPLLLVPVILVPSLVTLLLALVWPLVQYAGSPLLQGVALVGLIMVLVLLRFPVNVPRAPRWLSRWFYPGHLLIIAPF